MRALRFLITILAAVALVPLAAGAASAAPPANDEVAGAEVLHLGSEVQEDTTQATTNAGDATLNQNCGAPATNASVWYKYTPSVKRNVGIDTSASDYSTGLMVFEGTPTADSLISCGPVEVGLRARAGQTYYIMAFSDTDVNGGNLVLSLKNAPTPRVHMTLAKHGLAYHGGAARLHGTYRCKHADSFAFAEAHLFQQAGRLKIQADSGTPLLCNGKRHRWTARLVSSVGYYAAGPARARARIFACGLVQCRTAKAKSHVHLSWSKSPHRKWMDKPTSAPGKRAQHPLAAQRHWPSS